MFHVKHNENDTIAAIGTPIGIGGIGVIRVSGPLSRGILSKIFKSSKKEEIISYKMLRGWIIDNETEEKIDRAMACYMESPDTFTGEEAIEIYCHSSVPIIERILKIIILNGARIAGRGEFCRRAFMNGKMDLSQAEAVLDLIKAETMEGAGFAIKQLEGRLGEIIKRIREEIIKKLSEAEAYIDFAEDLSEYDVSGLKEHILCQINEIDSLLISSETGKIYRDGAAVTIVGKPNVGKSSIFNAMLGVERAIVTNIPGTTRDLIEEKINLKGIPVKIIDTAGIREHKDIAEKEGVKRALEEMNNAEVVIVVIDGSKAIDDIDKEVLNRTRKLKRIIVINKIDLGCRIDEKETKQYLMEENQIKTSAIMKIGINELLDGIYSNIINGKGNNQKNSILINARHKECLIRAKDALIRAGKGTEGGNQPETATIDLKEAAMALDEITGELVTDEVVNKIFQEFCVGK